MTYLNRIFSDFRNLQTEKKLFGNKTRNWWSWNGSPLWRNSRIKNCSWEFPKQIKLFQNFSKKVSRSKNSFNGNYFSCNQAYKSNGSRTNSNDSISKEYTCKCCNYCGSLDKCHITSCFEITNHLNWFGDPIELQITLALKDPKRFGYLRRYNNLVLQEHRKKTKRK